MPEKSIYDKYPAVLFASKRFILKNSYYTEKTNDYRNEYYKPKENKLKFTEKIVIDNNIQEKDPIYYGYNLSKNSGVILYQKKYKVSVIGKVGRTTNQGKAVSSLTLTKIEPNPNAPGIQIAEYSLYQDIKPGTEEKFIKESIKLAQDKYVYYVMDFKIPALTKRNISIK